MEKTSVVVPLSGDPITRWHRDLINQAISEYPDLPIIVAIGKNIDKKWLFTTDEKLDFIKHDLRDLLESWRVKIDFYEWLLSHYTYGQDAIAYRGERNNTDREYEKALYLAWKSQISTYESKLVPANPAYEWVSSSIAKAIAYEYGDLSSYVTPYVKQRMEERINKQYKVGLTWSIASGKSSLGRAFVEIGQDLWIPVHNIDRDDLAKEIYTSDLPIAVKNRWMLIKLFGDEVKMEHATIKNAINTTVLAEKLFDEPMKYMPEMKLIFEDWIHFQWSKAIRGKEWIILANAALLAEYGLSHIANHNTILVGANAELQIERMRTRNGYNDVQIQRRLSSQDTYDVKKIKLLDGINSDTGDWQIWEYDNSDPKFNRIKAERKFSEIVADIDINWLLRFQALCKYVPNQEALEKNFWGAEWLLNHIKSFYDKNGWEYHNWNHIMTVWNDAWKVRHMFSDDGFEKVQWAILFHDIIYKTTWTSRETRRNEEESAILAQQILTELWYDLPYIIDVMHLIKNTKHRDDPTTKDGKTLKDLDMKILASTPKAYEQYASAIRKEWNAFDDDEYKAGRIAFLQEQLGKDVFVVLKELEDQADDNMKKEIERLKSS